MALLPINTEIQTYLNTLCCGKCQIDISGIVFPTQVIWNDGTQDFTSPMLNDTNDLIGFVNTVNPSYEAEISGTNLLIVSTQCGVETVIMLIPPVVETFTVTNNDNGTATVTWTTSFANTVELFINGVSQGVFPVNGNNTFTLPLGTYTFDIVATNNVGTDTDTITLDVLNNLYLYRYITDGAKPQVFTQNGTIFKTIWGDGVVDTSNTHTYAVSPSTYEVFVYFTVPPTIITHNIDNNILDTISVPVATTQYYVDNNNLSDFYLSPNNFTAFRAVGNGLNSVDLSNHTNLQTLDLGTNNLTSLDLSSNPNLVNLLFYANPISAIDLSNNDNISVLLCYSCNLTNLTVSNMLNLTNLNCGINSISTLDLTMNTNLSILSITNTPMTSINLTNNTLLNTLNAINGALTTISLTTNVALQYLYLSGCDLTALNISANTNLRTLWINGNLISTLDITNNPLLKDLRANACSLDVTSVSDILIKLDTFGLTNGYCRLDLQIPAAIPNSAGQLAKLSLISKGWTVLTD